MTGEKASEKLGFCYFRFSELQRHRGPLFPRHLSTGVLESISEIGQGLTVGTVTDILCRALTEKRGHSCSTKGKNAFLIPCLNN